MTQTERVLEMLRAAGKRGVCSQEFYRSYLPHARNRISVELRDRGFVIVRDSCEENDHGTGHYFRYVLFHDPERVPVQEALLT